MNHGNILKNKTDEWMTPKNAVVALAKYLWSNNSDILLNKTIWCPFDNDDSEFVKEFKRLGLKVVNTHISNGEDFFNYDEPLGEIVISNPPFSKKDEVLERLFSMNVHFALLLPQNGLYDSKKRFKLFKENDHSLMIFNKRINYLDSDGVLQKGVPFSSCYVGDDVLLGSENVFVELEP